MGGGASKVRELLKSPLTLLNETSIREVAGGAFNKDVFDSISNADGLVTLAQFRAAALREFKAKRRHARICMGARPKHAKVFTPAHGLSACKKAAKKAVQAIKQADIESFFDEEFDVHGEEEACLYLEGNGLVSEDPDPTVAKPASGFKRLAFIRPEGKLFKDGVHPGDVQQGQVGSCWLLGAIMAVSCQKGLIESLFLANDFEKGVYAIRFFKNGSWEHCLVDDRVGVEDDEGEELTFSSNTDPDELWVAILEKAYAKLHGCYQAIDGGEGMRALVDLTGGVARSLDVEAARADPAEFFAEISAGLAAGSLYVVSCEGDSEEVQANGLVSGHMYGVLRTATFDGAKLVKVRNPWGAGEWDGAWSDASAEWSERALQALEHTLGDDGTFWMSIGDFVANWSSIEQCVMFPPSWHMMTCASEASVMNSEQGGCFSLSSEVGVCGVDEDAAVVVVFGQDDQRLLGMQDEYTLAIGFRVYRRDAEGNEEETVLEVECSAERSVTHSENLLLPACPGDYCIELLLEVEDDRLDKSGTAEDGDGEGGGEEVAEDVGVYCRVYSDKKLVLEDLGVVFLEGEEEEEGEGEEEEEEEGEEEEEEEEGEEEEEEEGEEEEEDVH